ncbi:MAG: DUF5985 family protein [Chthoniobacterales bacterium]
MTLHSFLALQVTTVTPDFLSGAIAMACLVVAAFFLRFWQKTRDRLFLFFSMAFLLLMLERILRSFCQMGNELAPFVYSVRLVAFLLLIIAIIDKNRRA